mgnify:CR=1 FL=1
MASLQFSFKSRYSLKNYKDVIDTYEWLVSCLKYALSDYTDLKITSSFSFSCDNLDIDCSSIDEFKEHAFGLDITPRHLFVNGTESSKYPSKTIAHFWTRNNHEDVIPMLELTCYEKKHLIEIKDSLDLDLSVLISKKPEKIVTMPEEYKSSIDSSTKSHISTNQTTVVTKEIASKHNGLFFSKLFWKLIIPIAVIVLSTVLILLLKIQ